MTWTNQTFTDGPILTSTQMNNLQADITAQANADASAPQNVQASIGLLSATAISIATAAVGTSEIKTSLASTAGSASLAEYVYFTFNDYCFFPMFHSASPATLSGHTTAGSDGSQPRCSLYFTSASSYDVDHRYVAAS